MSSALQNFTDGVRDRIVERFGLVEVGDPYETFVMTESGERVGEVRVWTGPLVPSLVDSRLVVPSMGIDSVMLHAFTDPRSAAPHLTSDVAGMNGRLALGLDLTPRVDLATEPAYLDAVYAPLTETHRAIREVEGATPMDVPLRLRAFTSPWLTGASVPESRLPEIGRAYDAYLERFFALAEDGAPPVAIDGDALLARDALARRAQFDPASDPVWDFLAGLLGRESVDTLLDLVRTPGPPAPR